MTQGEDCPLDAIRRPDYPEVMPMAVSVNAEVKTIRCEKKNCNVYFTFCFLLLFPASCNWHLLGGYKPGCGAYRHVVKGKSVLVRMENRQECKIKVGFGSSLRAEV